MNLCMNIHKKTTKNVWHLLMNLKKKKLYKLLKWTNKKCKNFDIYNVMLHFFFFLEKKKEIQFTPVYQKS